MLLTASKFLLFMSSMMNNGGMRFAPRIARSTDEVVTFANSMGFRCEVHEVETADDYLVTLHRVIPTNPSNITKDKGPVLLMHGVGFTSMDFVISGRNSLAFSLADEGYDVWMANARGNTYSEKHKYLATDSEKYWDFSFHEIGKYDLPAEIDYILNTTGHKSLNYFGHSQGGSSILVLLSTNPSYNSKIKQAILLAPAAFMGNAPPTIFQASSDIMVSFFAGNFIRVIW
jgi:pimeloyl-ACP methyl ester carboxylesterase